jgi:hypothetical protein
LVKVDNRLVEKKEIVKKGMAVRESCDRVCLFSRKKMRGAIDFGLCGLWFGRGGCDYGGGHDLFAVSFFWFYCY